MIATFDGPPLGACVGQLDLFDRVIMPVSLYDCEVWSYEIVEIVELIPLKFL